MRYLFDDLWGRVCAAGDHEGGDHLALGGGAVGELKREETSLLESLTI